MTVFFNRFICIGFCLIATSIAQAKVIYECDLGKVKNVKDKAIVPGVKGGQAVVACPESLGSASDCISKIDLTPETRGLRVAVPKTTQKGAVGVKMIPRDDAHSLNAWFIAADAPGNTTGQHQLRGSMDFFIRINQPLAEFDQFRIISSGYNQRASLHGIQFVITNIRGADVRLDFAVQNRDGKVLPLPHADLPAGYSLKPNVLYHVAITLDTDDAGVTTSKLFVMPGPGEIDANARILEGGIVVSKTFNLDEKLVKTGLSAGEFILGPHNLAQAQGYVHDFGRFRIYNDIPEKFAGLP